MSTRAVPKTSLIKIAIIGSGIAGLTAAYRLSRAKATKVTLFERQPLPGIDAHRAQILRDGQTVTVDVPSRMFNRSQWPNLSRLYDEIGVQSLPVEASQSFSMLETRARTAMNSKTGSRTYLRQDMATKTVFPIRELIWPSNREIAKETVRFLRVGTEDLGKANFCESDTETLRDYLKRRSFANNFIYRYLYPTLASTVCTCSYQSLDRYPARIVLQTLANLIQPAKLMRTLRGTSDVANRLCDPNIETQNEVTVKEVTDIGDAVRLSLSDGQSLLFDHAIIATQANTALKLIRETCHHERDALRAIRYDKVPVIVHSDMRMMPKSRSKWSTFNMLTESSLSSASCTVWLNRFYGNWNFSEPIFQTIGSPATIDETKIIRQATLYRSVADADSVAALDRLDRLHQQDQRRVWYCGSWASHGLPLLESAVVSAERVAAQVTKIARQLDAVENGR